MSRTFTLLLASIAAVAPALAAADGAGAIELTGQGVQIYTCVAAVGKAAWKLKAPDAILRDAAGRAAGRHFAGPSWQATDGSTVVGSLVVASAAPDPAAIPWLVVRAASHQGAGMFADVAYVTRTHTVGGKAPARGCDAAHVGGEVRVPYTATYDFFTPIAP